MRRDFGGGCESGRRVGEARASIGGTTIDGTRSGRVDGREGHPRSRYSCYRSDTPDKGAMGRDRRKGS